MKAKYTKTDSPSGVKFEVTPASAFKAIGYKTFLYGGTFIGSAIIGACINSANTRYGYQHADNNAGWWTFFILYGAIFFFMRWYFKRTESKLRMPAQYVANDKGIVSQGVSIDASSMHRFVLKNWMTKNEGKVDVSAFAVAYTNNLGGILQAGAMTFQHGVGQISDQAKREYQRKFGEFCWQLNVEAGGRETMLACGLDQVTAYGLMEDTHRAIWGR